jgi:hypothetical protein
MLAQGIILERVGGLVRGNNSTDVMLTSGARGAQGLSAQLSAPMPVAECQTYPMWLVNTLQALCLSVKCLHRALADDYSH